MSLKLPPQTPTMVVRNHMDERMTPKAPFGEYSEIYIMIHYILHLQLLPKTVPFWLKLGILVISSTQHRKLLFFYLLCLLSLSAA